MTLSGLARCATFIVRLPVTAFARSARPYDAGPILVTFLEPLPANLTGAHLPPAFAYDFSGIAIHQWDAPFAAHVAHELDLLATAINGAFKGVAVWIDKQPGATHGKLAVFSRFPGPSPGADGIECRSS
jgi:hypothetical protein